MAQQTPNYAYNPLPEGRIRVLTLKPRDDGTCVGSLQTLRPHKSRLLPWMTPVYFALSYCWGAETATYPFTCDEQNLPVRANLLAALKYLVDVIGDSPIWIDAICINQSDEEEKFGQLRMMPLIYGNAAKVWIWLGPETEDTVCAAENMRQVVADFKKVRSTKCRNASAIAMPGAACIRGIGDILTRPWWSRLWVLQEAGLARAAVFLCGRSQIPWSRLRDLTKQLGRLGLTQRFRPAAHRRRSLLDSCNGFSELLNIELVRHRHDVNFPFHILCVGRQRDCFDPRDRVNALMGLMPPHMREGYVWEPGEDIAALYTGFAATMVLLDELLLSLCETSVRRAGLPSWVPDFHERSPADVLAVYDGYHAGHRAYLTSDIKFNDEDVRQIKLPSLVVDVVSEVVPGAWEDLVLCEDSVELPRIAARNLIWLETVTDLVTTISSDRGSGGSSSFDKPPPSELWRVLIGDQVFDVAASRLRLLSGFTRLYDSLVDLRSADCEDKFRAAHEHLPRILHDLALGITSAIPHHESTEYAYLKLVGKICAYRRLFVTRAGRVGLGPVVSTHNDVLVVSKEFNIPFALRRVESPPHLPSEAAFNLLGEVYLHGVMRGECLRTKPDPKFQDLLVI